MSGSPSAFLPEMDVSPSALGSCIPEKELYTPGVKAKLNKSFLAFSSTCFWYYSFRENILIQSGCFSYMVHIYFQSKNFRSSLGNIFQFLCYHWIVHKKSGSKSKV